VNRVVHVEKPNNNKLNMRDETKPQRSPNKDQEAPPRDKSKDQSAIAVEGLDTA
jgi:hypothetical protein